jgi:hypothetical protein
MRREFQSRPRRDRFVVEKRLEVRLMYVRETVHRGPNGDLDSLGRDTGIIEATVVTCHLSGGNSELTEAARHLARSAGHPLAWIEARDFADYLAFSRQLSRIE